VYVASNGGDILGTRVQEEKEMDREREKRREREREAYREIYREMREVGCAQT